MAFNFRPTAVWQLISKKLEGANGQFPQKRYHETELATNIIKWNFFHKVAMIYFSTHFYALF